MLKFYLLDHTRIHIIHDFHSHTVFHCFIYFTGGETYGSQKLSLFVAFCTSWLSSRVDRGLTILM